MKHVLFTLSGCPPSLLDDELYIRETVASATEFCGATLLSISSHRFEPQGVTCVAMLSESHISIHTWPEFGKAVCDAFTCGAVADPHQAMVYIQDKLEALSTTSNTLRREFDTGVEVCYDK